MNSSASPVDWVELPANSMQTIQPGTEGQRCYGGSTCVAPPQLRVATGDSTREFFARVEESEAIVKELLKREELA